MPPPPLLAEVEASLVSPPRREVRSYQSSLREDYRPRCHIWRLARGWPGPALGRRVRAGEDRRPGVLCRLRRLGFVTSGLSTLPLLLEDWSQAASGRRRGRGRVWQA